MSEASTFTRRIDLRQGGFFLIQEDTFHPGKFRVTIGQGGATETVVFNLDDAQRVSSMLLSAIFHGGRIR